MIHAEEETKKNQKAGTKSLDHEKMMITKYYSFDLSTN